MVIHLADNVLNQSFTCYGLLTHHNLTEGVICVT